MKIKGLRAKVPRQVPKAWKLLDGSRFAAGTWGDGISRPLTEEWLVYLDELAFLLASATPDWEWLAVWSKVPCRNETGGDRASAVPHGAIRRDDAARRERVGHVARVRV